MLRASFANLPEEAAPSTEMEPVSREDIMSRVLADQRRDRIRNWQRAMTAPYVASGATWVTGECAHLVTALSHQPLTVATTTAAAAASAVFVTRFGLRKVYSQRWSMRFWLAGATATAWSALAAVAGPHWTPGWLLTGTLAVSTVGLAGRWWREHRITTIPPVDAMPELAVEVDEAAGVEPVSGARRIQERWDEFLAAKGKKLYDSRLTNQQELPTGWAFEVILNPDHNDFDSLWSLRGKIAAVMGLSPADILIDPHPTGDHSRAVLTVLVVNPLKDGIPYQGPRYDNGFIAAGMFADGTGWGSVQIADHENSVINGLVTGDPGMGKSVFLENLGMSAIHSQRWKVFYCDGSEDADSSSLLNDYMTWSMAGIKGAWAQLRAVKSYLKARGLENNSLPPEIRGVNPSPERMGLLWILDEFHRLTKADKAFAAEVAQVVRLGRKKGCAVWVATQGVDLGDDFAGIAALRDILTSRNVVCFYSSSTYAHNMINGPKIAPNTLPSDGGYAYLRADGSMRAAQLRTDYSKDMTPWARELPDAPWDELGLLSVKKVMDKHCVSPEQAREQATVSLAAYKRALKMGLLFDDDEEDGEVKPAVKGPFADLAKQVPAALGQLRIVTDAKPSKSDMILAELDRRGTATTRELIDALGPEFEGSIVTQTLTRHAQKGTARDLGHGKWGSVAVGAGVA